ncbi:MAG: GxxExxY protein [Verrucomicrobia bacterium]|nr:GxxExxY protein [Verrucomicrobiota bacterium]
MDFKHQELTEKVIKAFYGVYNTLGYGFLEKVYENAFVHELGKMQLAVKQQERVDVHYDGILVGEYFADVVVKDLVLVELKSSRQLIDKDEAQLLNYLKATKYEVGLLLNFGTKPEIKRKAFDNERK